MIEKRKLYSKIKTLKIIFTIAWKRLCIIYGKGVCMRPSYVFQVFLILLLILTQSCSKEKSGEKSTPGPAKQALKSQDTFFGWNSLTLENRFARINVVPDLGGKIMGYELRGEQILWHDSKKEGYIEKDQGYGYGQKFFNPGGAKVWPAPQGWSGKNEWPGPPDNVLDGSPYEGKKENEVITVTSPRDDGEGRTGLQFKHTYSLTPSSSLVNLDISMTNVVNRPVTWSLWHIATVPVDRKFTVYVPVNKGDWHVIFGDKNNPQWLNVENGLFRARYDKLVGKVGMKVREGWGAWNDEENGLIYVLFFPIKKGSQYPDGGSNFEIWTSGKGTIKVGNNDITSEYSPETANMELEVMGPLTRLNPGDSSHLNITWAACKASTVKRIIPAGVVAEDIAVQDGIITAKFGVFYGGNLQVVYLDKNKKQIGIKNLNEVSPLAEVIIQQSKSDYSVAAGIRYQIQTYDKTKTLELGEIKFK
jgi:hypothetical protein